MSNRYIFETINDHNRYTAEYDTNSGFYFTNEPYFTMVGINSTSGGYGKAYIGSSINFATKEDISFMLASEVRVDLNLNGNIILQLTKIDEDYAYFSNGELTLKVDSNGDVTEEGK